MRPRREGRGESRPDAVDVSVERTGRLVSASCTTGWLDWIHGELWLLPDGLLRLRTSLRTTRSHRQVNVLTAGGALPTRRFADKEIEQLAARHRTNLWIPAEQIVAA